MSTDFGRKDLSDKIEEKITPQAAKGPLDTSKEHVTGHADHVARDLKTDDHKSLGQSTHDKASRLTSTSDDHKSVGDKIKDAIPGLHSGKRSDAAEVIDPNTSTTTSDVINKNL